MSEHQIKFYQTGTFTVGNRLLQPDQRSGQANIERYNSLNSGHRACQGCGEALGARYAVDAAMRATEGRLIAANATGCLEVFSTPYPETSWQLAPVEISSSTIFSATRPLSVPVWPQLHASRQKNPANRWSV